MCRCWQHFAKTHERPADEYDEQTLHDEQNKRQHEFDWQVDGPFVQPDHSFAPRLIGHGAQRLTTRVR
jgi:hypothetical protein